MQPDANAPIGRRRPATPEFLQDLSDMFKERFSTGQSVMDRHGRDESPYDTTPPDCVVFATTTTEVAEAVRMSGTPDTRPSWPASSCGRARGRS